MANALGVCLLSIALFCCTNLSLARQVPKECSKGPVYWCQNLRQGADCGAVGHCIGTVWESQNYDVTSNEVSDKFVRLFRQLKDVKDLINEEYLSGRVASACHDVPYKAMASACKENTAGLHKYLYHVLLSDTSPEGMCQIIGMCNNEKLDHLINNNKKKAEPKKQANQKIPLVGASRCTWGPSYWCNNFSTGHECHATKHCVERVWPKIQFPEDNDSVCKICTDMVKQARDQLESNQTQAPIFHALGSVITLLGGWRHGATLTLPAPLYDARATLQALHDHQCSIVTGTPTMFVDMLSQMRGSSLKPRLRRALAAGAPLSPQLVRDIHNRLHVDSVKTLYGLTEATAGLFQSLPEDGVDVVADTVGFLHDHLEAKVVDQEGKTVPWGSSGELLQRGYSTMLGYWAEPGKTSEVLADDGWLSTGDKFVLRPDGYARIVGRLKDIVVRGGENIAPKEIEDLLNTHPDIVESQVVGVSDERVGEELCAVVRLRPGASITLDDARRHLAGKLARFKMPRILKTVDDFPKTTSGKIQKFKLKDMVEAGKI